MTQASTLITEARSYAQTMLTAAESAIDEAIGAVNWSGEPHIPVWVANLPDKPDMRLEVTRPLLQTVGLDLPEEPSSALSFQNISPIDAGNVPTLRGTAPIYTAPNKPNQLAAFNIPVPSVSLSAQFPNAPELLVPVDPALPTRTEPEKPLISIPTFGGAMPTGLPVAPANLDTRFNAAYHTAAPEFIAMVNGHVDAQLLKINPQYHVQMARLEAQLAKYLDGGTGLNPAVENAIYERARSKNDAEARRVRDQSLSDAAARGFTMPTGALLSATQQARQAGADANAAAAREIVVMQAEIEQKNLQFAVTTSSSLRTAMISASLSYMQNLGTLNGQALDYAKTILSSITEIFNNEVKLFTVRLDGYKAEAAVYETLMRAALAGVEVYKAEISAFSALINADMSKIEVYKAKIDSLKAIAGMYETQVKAVVEKASLERLRIDLFQAQVQAYGAQVSAKNAEWQGYTAQLNGEETKAKIYGEQVQAYGAEVNGFRAAVEAKAEEIKATALSNDAKAKQYAAQMDGYKSVVQARGEVARVQMENQRQEVIAFEADTKLAVAKGQLAMEYYKTVGSIMMEDIRVSTQGATAQAEASARYMALLATLHQANATIHANLAGSAMAGMNALAVESATDQ